MGTDSVDYETRALSSSGDLWLTFWRATSVGAVGITIAIFAVCGWFFQTGLGNAVEALLGALGRHPVIRRRVTVDVDPLTVL